MFVITLNLLMVEPKDLARSESFLEMWTRLSPRLVQNRRGVSSCTNRGLSVLTHIPNSDTMTMTRVFLI